MSAQNRKQIWQMRADAQKASLIPHRLTGQTRQIVQHVFCTNKKQQKSY